jgi:hypothetical protein
MLADAGYGCSAPFWQALSTRGLIPILIDQNPYAHSRRPIDMMRLGRSMRVFQAHQQMKEELGLNHFEGRSWIGLHRHALMTMMAYAFLPVPAARSSGTEKRIACPPPHPSMPAIQQAILESPQPAITAAMPAL